MVFHKEPIRKKEMHDYLRNANVIEQKYKTPILRPQQERHHNQTVQPAIIGRKQTQLFPEELYYGQRSTEAARGHEATRLREQSSSRNSPHSALQVYPRQGKSNLFPSVGRDLLSTTG